MEFCRSGSVQAIFEAGPATLKQCRQIITDLLNGLEVLHARNLLHRDIKPANILVDDGRYKLSDFGLVTDELIAGYAAAPEYNYMDHLAIEVWKGGGTSKASDYWAVGMTLYRILHGRSWYEEQLKARLPRDIIPLGGFAASLKWLPHVPDSWRRFIRKLMHDDKHSRYLSATAALAALAKLPVSPNWTCNTATTLTSWSHTNKTHKTEVQWTNIPRSHKCIAMQTNLTSGKSRKLLDESFTSSSEANSRLMEFFTSF